MAESDSDFLRIMASNFSEAERAVFAEPATSTSPEPESQRDEEEHAERIYHASLDPGIADCLLFGDVETDELVARLQNDYDLTAQEAQKLIEDIGYQTGEIVDYGDEA